MASRLQEAYLYWILCHHNILEGL